MSTSLRSARNAKPTSLRSDGALTAALLAASCVVAEHLLGIDRRLHVARNRPIEGSREGWAIGAVDEDRFTDQGLIGRAGRIFVWRSDRGGIGSGDAPLAKKAATLSFCHGSRSLRMTMAIWWQI